MGEMMKAYQLRWLMQEIYKKQTKLARKLPSQERREIFSWINYSRNVYISSVVDGAV